MPNRKPPTADQLRLLLTTLKAMRAGDFSVRMDAGDDGLMGDIADALNDVLGMQQQMEHELARVRDVVGKRGQLHERVAVAPARGGWASSVSSVNGLISDLVVPVSEASRVLAAVTRGDLSQKITVETQGALLAMTTTINTLVDQVDRLAREVMRVAYDVGVEGTLGGQMQVRGVGGVWKELADSVNALSGNLTAQVRSFALVATAVARGDLSQKITAPARGEVLELKKTINTMVDHLQAFRVEIARLAHDVGTEGKLGGQVEVPGVTGVWKELLDNVNTLASNLTVQLRDVSKVATAIAHGDLGQKITVEARGEILQIKNVINMMVDHLSSFASEVTRVAKEVGTDGKLGGQADVRGVSGVWRDLTASVNTLAARLTSQVRAISDVSTAVTRGDLTRHITIDASGEVAALKDNINQMIENLRVTTEKTHEQDWLKTNLARFSAMMQGQRSTTAVAQLIMSELTPLLGAAHGTFFMRQGSTLNLIASYAHDGKRTSYALKEGLIGQCAFEKKRIHLAHVPADFSVTSSLIHSRAASVVVLPVLFEGEVLAVIELASFKAFTENNLRFLDQLMDSIGVVLNVISSSMWLEEKARLLEQKNREVEHASHALEEKAEQLSTVSRYKSEFLANMSHELRTPLNSLLILSRMLIDNKEATLTPAQVKWATTIHSSGMDLLALINDILDLSKVEAGKMPVAPRDTRIADVRDHLEQTFRPIAEQKGLTFSVDVARDVPVKFRTDINRLQQILKNLLANAFKFTSEGHVKLAIRMVRGQIAFTVTDTGIGIPREKQQLIFEAFQQADGTTSRKYGGTGLGLTISREIARLLGGSIDVESAPGIGSAFTLTIPEQWAGPEPLVREPAPEPVDTPALPVDADFNGRKVLIIDDDMRNIFAIASVLERAGMQVLYAENGRDGVALLKENPDVELVLMDVMMPELDGIEATREIRKDPRFARLPIISLTAKAMKGDRETCLAAGASDYVTKPVGPEKLLSVMHAWMNGHVGNLQRH